MVNLLALWEAHEHRRRSCAGRRARHRARRPERRLDVLVRGRRHVLGARRRRRRPRPAARQPLRPLLPGPRPPGRVPPPRRRRHDPRRIALDDHAGLLWERTTSRFAPSAPSAAPASYRVDAPGIGVCEPAARHRAPFYPEERLEAPPTSPSTTPRPAGSGSGGCALTRPSGNRSPREPDPSGWFGAVGSAGSL